MGGRGTSSGISEKGKAYASQYQTLLKDGNIAFVKAKTDHPESLFETQTKGRVYVTVGGNDLLRITYYDTENKRTKQIDLDHSHENMKPHVHHGYYHKENDGKKGATNLSPEEKTMVERVEKIWYNHLKQR